MASFKHKCRDWAEPDPDPADGRMICRMCGEYVFGDGRRYRRAQVELQDGEAADILANFAKNGEEPFQCFKGLEEHPDPEIVAAYQAFQRTTVRMLELIVKRHEICPEKDQIRAREKLAPVAPHCVAPYGIVAAGPMYEFPELKDCLFLGTYPNGSGFPDVDAYLEGDSIAFIAPYQSGRTPVRNCSWSLLTTINATRKQISKGDLRWKPLIDAYDAAVADRANREANGCRAAMTYCPNK